MCLRRNGGGSMKRWNQRVRLGVIAVASFVLLVTVLPQVASGLGLGPLANRLASSVSCSAEASALPRASAALRAR